MTEAGPPGISDESLTDLEQRVKEDILGDLDDLETTLSKRDADISRDVMQSVADAIRGESRTDTRDDDIRYGSIVTGFFRQFFTPVFQLAWRVISAIVLTAIFLGVGAFRLSNWLFTFRTFWIFFLLSWVATAAFVANYEIIADTVRPGFQILDDIYLRGLAPIANDFVSLVYEPYCEFQNFYYQFFFCIIMVILNAIELIVKCLAVLPLTIIDPENTTPCDDATVNDFIDDNIFGVEWIDLVSPNFRSVTRTTFNPPVQSALLYGMPVKVVNNPVVQKRYNDLFARMSLSLAPNDPSRQEQIKKNLTRWNKDASVWKRYDPQFLNAANIGFDFGWDPDVFPVYPQVTGSGIGYEIYETTYEVIALLTDILTTSIMFFITCFKQAIADSIFLFIVESFECISEIAPGVFSLIKDELELALSGEDQEVPIDDILDIWDTFFNECVVDFVETFFEDIFLGFWKKIFDFFAELILQIPCIRFDSFGCFIGSLLECIAGPLVNFTVANCLNCAEDDGECIEDQCRDDASNGILPILDCIFDLIIELAAMGICPVFEAFYCYCIFIGEIYELLAELLLEIEDFCNVALDIAEFSLDFGKDFDILDYDFGFDFDFDFDFNLDNPDSPISTGDGNSDDDDNNGPSDDLFCYAFDSPGIGLGVNIDVSEALDTAKETCNIIFDVVDGFCEDEVDISVADCNDDHPFDIFLDLVPDLSKREEMRRQGVFYKREDYTEDDMKNLFKDGSFVFDTKEAGQEDEEANGRRNGYPALQRSRERRRQMNNRPLTKQESEVEDAIEEERGVRQCLKEDQCYAFNQDQDAETKWFHRKKPSYRLASYYRTRIDPYVGKNFTRETITEEVARKIRKDKLLHLFLSQVSPSTHTERYRPKDEEAFQRRLERRRERYRSRISGEAPDTSLYDEQRADPNSLYSRMKRLERTTNNNWDWDAPFVQDYNNFRGNASTILLHTLLLTTKFDWSRFPGFDFDPENGGLRYASSTGSSSLLGVRFPSHDETMHHFSKHKTHVYFAKSLMSGVRFMRSYLNEATVNVDKFLRDLDDSYHHSDAPSERHAHLYTSSEERKQLRSVIKRYQAENPEYRELNQIRGIGARLESYLHIGAAALFAPHKIDFAVNRLAIRGPEYDEAITGALKTFGMKRRLYNITQDILYWTAEKDVQYTRDMEAANGGKPLYTSEDYIREIEEGKKILRGEIDPLSERAWSNSLYANSTLTEAQAAHYRSMFPGLTHPAPEAVSTNMEGLRRNIKLQERLGFFAGARILFKNPEIIMSVVPVALTTSLAQHFIKIWTNYALLWFGIIFTDYVEITGPNILMSIRDLAEVILYNIVYGINYVLQVGLVLLTVIVLLVVLVIVEVVFMILRYVFPQVSIIFTIIEKIITTAITALLPLLIVILPVPPDPLMDSRGAPTQSPIKYVWDIFNCTNVENSCTTRDDCSGGATCHCADSTRLPYKSLFWELSEDRECTGNTGRCICMGQQVCLRRERTVPLTNLIVPNCRAFDYDLAGQVWYASKGSFLDRWWTLTKASVKNFIATSKFTVRSVLAGWNVFLSRALFLGLLLIAVIFVLFIARRIRWFFTVTFFGLVIFYFTPVYTEWVATDLIPFIEDLSNGEFQKYLFDFGYVDDFIVWFLDNLYVDELFGEILDFITFPNASPANPVGSPDLINGEFNCFVIGVFSGVPGLLFFLVVFALGFLAFSTGLVRMFVLLALFALLSLLRILWAFVWPWLQSERLRNQYEKVSDFVVNTELSDRLQRLANRIDDNSRPSSMFRSIKKRLGRTIPREYRSEAERTSIVKDLREELTQQREHTRKLVSILCRMNRGDTREEYGPSVPVRTRRAKTGGEKTQYHDLQEESSVEMNVRSNITESIDSILSDVENPSEDTEKRRRRLVKVEEQTGDRIFDSVGEYLDSVPTRIRGYFSSRSGRPHNE